ncbi:polysaccharide deacetylase family protein [Paenibacillus gorillae]|uniref:polysaccharide deacetylase family protein n=1 Tax=Paenibacillus gorillae TaxID=1243662 RepID=UPI000694A022|nr:polysaccharide deacetylase family protein [Paenibacillus gorillae]
MGNKRRIRRRSLAAAVMLVVISIIIGGCGTGMGLSLAEITGKVVKADETDQNNNKPGAVEQGDLVDYPRPPEKSGIDNGDTGKGDEHTAPPSEQPSKPGNVTTPDKEQEHEPETPPVEHHYKDKIIALTFDDGPDKKYTTAILDILKEKGVKATFFVVGQQVKKEPEVLQRIVDEGHAIGNHSMNHKDMAKLNAEQIQQEIDEADKLIEEAVGFKPKMFRAPYGAVSDTLKSMLKDEDRELVSWNIDTRDWAGTPVSDMREMIRKKAKPHAIILMHSFGNKNIKHTVEMLPYVIDDLKKKGYTFVTPDEMAG